MSELAPGTHFQYLDHGGRTRRFTVHIPATAQKPYPVVLAFHGAGGTARIMLHHSRWLPRADTEGFVVIAPEGTPPNLNEKPSFRFNPQLWNLGGASTAAPTGNSDDVGYVRAILDDLPRYLNFDPQRIYATGFSNGAGLCFRLAVEMGDRFAALGPIAGYPYLKDGPPSRPIPTYYVVGALDPLIPWEGGTIISPWSDKPTHRHPLRDALLKWRDLAGFRAVETVTDHDVLIGLADHDSEFRYTIIPGLGHHWPGGKDVGVPQQVLGPRVKTFDATERLWNFFQKYRLPR
jgi:polyhydroxybutyrate depolymerase